MIKSFDRDKPKIEHFDNFVRDFVERNKFEWTPDHVRVNPTVRDVVFDLLKWANMGRFYVSKEYTDIIESYVRHEFAPHVQGCDILTQEEAIALVTKKSKKKSIGKIYRIAEWQFILQKFIPGLMTPFGIDYSRHKGIYGIIESYLDPLPRNKGEFYASDVGKHRLNLHWTDPYPVPSSVAAKVQVQTVKKKLNAKMRSFIVSGPEMPVNLGRYCYDFNQKLNDHCTKHPFFMGFNPWGGRWDTFFRQQLFSRPSWWSIDYKKFEGTVNNTFTAIEGRFRWDMFKPAYKIPIHQRRFNFYWRDTTFTLVECLGVLFWLDYGNTSGNVNTVQKASFANFCNHVYCYIRYCDDLQLAPSFAHFKEILTFYIQGDDTIVNTQIDILKFYGYAKEIGFYLTIESLVPRPLRDVAFLSCVTRELYYNNQCFYIQVYEEIRLRASWHHGDVTGDLMDKIVGKKVVFKRRSFVRSCNLLIMSFPHKQLYHEIFCYLTFLSKDPSVINDRDDGSGLKWSDIQHAWLTEEEIIQLYTDNDNAFIQHPELEYAKKPGMAEGIEENPGPFLDTLELMIEWYFIVLFSLGALVTIIMVFSGVKLKFGRAVEKMAEKRLVFSDPVKDIHINNRAAFSLSAAELKIPPEIMAEYEDRPDMFKHFFDDWGFGSIIDLCEWDDYDSATDEYERLRLIWANWWDDLSKADQAAITEKWYAHYNMKLPQNLDEAMKALQIVKPTFVKLMTRNLHGDTCSKLWDEDTDDEQDDEKVEDTQPLPTYDNNGDSDETKEQINNKMYNEQGNDAAFAPVVPLVAGAVHHIKDAWQHSHPKTTHKDPILTQAYNYDGRKSKFGRVVEQVALKATAPIGKVIDFIGSKIANKIKSRRLKVIGHSSSGAPIIDKTKDNIPHDVPVQKLQKDLHSLEGNKPVGKKVKQEVKKEMKKVKRQIKGGGGKSRTARIAKAISRSTHQKMRVPKGMSHNLIKVMTARPGQNKFKVHKQNMNSITFSARENLTAGSSGVNVGGNLIFAQAIGVSGLNLPVLSRMASLFEKYRFKSFKVVIYFDQASTATGGARTFFDDDPSLGPTDLMTLAQRLQFATRHDSSVQHRYSDNSWVSVMPKHLISNTVKGHTENIGLYTAGNHSADVMNQAYFYTVVEIVAGSSYPFVIEVEYTVDMWDPTAPAASNAFPPSTVTVMNKGVAGLGANAVLFSQNSSSQSYGFLGPNLLTSDTGATSNYTIRLIGGAYYICDVHMYGTGLSLTVPAVASAVRFEGNTAPVYSVLRTTTNNAQTQAYTSLLFDTHTMAGGATFWTIITGGDTTITDYRVTLISFGLQDPTTLALKEESDIERAVKAALRKEVGPKQIPNNELWGGKLQYINKDDPIVEEKKAEIAALDKMALVAKLFERNDLSLNTLSNHLAQNGFGGYELLDKPKIISEEVKETKRSPSQTRK